MTASTFDYDRGSAPRSLRSNSPLLTWTEEQLGRLKFEWKKLQRSFAFHPHVRILSTQGDPPSEFEIEFRVRTLSVSDDGDLEYSEAVPLRLSLPASFPYEPPSVRPLKALFHPNLSLEGIHLSGSWRPADTLVDYLQRVGDLLAWRTYDPQRVVNTVAVDWMEANASLLPIDPEADFSPGAGGDPIQRLSQFGGAALDQARAELAGMRDALLEESTAPTLEEVRDFSRRTRQTLSLFMDSDVPESLSQEAATLDEWARQLPGSVPVWQALREQRWAVQEVHDAIAALDGEREPLLEQFRAIEALAPAHPPADVASGLRLIPARKAMEAIQLKLPALLRETEASQQGLREKLQLLDVPVPTDLQQNDSPWGRQLQQALADAAVGVTEARDAGGQALATIEPVLERARLEAAAVRQIGAWREFLDLYTTGQVLEKKVAKLGAAGVHAYFIENASGNFGPFQHDEPVDLGVGRVAVRSTSRNRLRLINVETTGVIGKSDTGVLTIDLVGSGGKSQGLTTFRLAERWEDLAVQFDYLVRQTGQLIVQLTAGHPAAPSWCGALLALLDRPESIQLLRQQHQQAARPWRALLQDLQALGPVKARIETWNFVQRLGEVIPQLMKRLASQQGILEKCIKDLGAIVARCKRDLDTNRLIIPPKLAKPYADQTGLRDQAQKEVARLEKLLVQLGAHVARQLSSAGTVGSSAIPSFRVLPAFPPELEQLIFSMHDSALADLVRELELKLKMPLLGEGWRPTEPAPEPQPAYAAVEAIPSPEPENLSTAEEAPAEAEEAELVEEIPQAEVVAEGMEADPQAMEVHEELAEPQDEFYLPNEPAEPEPDNIHM